MFRNIHRYRNNSIMKTEYILVVTILITILIGYAVRNYLHCEPLTLRNSSIAPKQEQLHFYRSINGKNITLRPEERDRIYYNRDDTRIPYRIRSYMNPIFDKALVDFPLKFEEKPVIVYASGDTEGGMPHTFDNYVIYPLRDDITSRPKDSIWETCIHELCHVHQRQKPNMWKDLYRKLGFEEIHTDDISHLIQTNEVVANPDAGTPGMPQIGWWKYHGQVGMILFNPDAITIRDHHSIAFPIDKDSAKDTTNYLKEVFGPFCNQYDHPNEITACLIANQWDKIVRSRVNKDSFVIQGIPNKIDPIEITRDWLKSHHTTLLGSH